MHTDHSFARGHKGPAVDALVDWDSCLHPGPVSDAHKGAIAAIAVLDSSITFNGFLRFIRNIDLYNKRIISIKTRWRLKLFEP